MTAQVLLTVEEIAALSFAGAALFTNPHVDTSTVEGLHTALKKLAQAGREAEARRAKRRAGVTTYGPKGAVYMTILDYYLAFHPEALDLMDDVVEGTLTDGFKLRHLCRRHGMKPSKVPAPELLQRKGIDIVNAYPVTLLKEHYGD